MTTVYSEVENPFSSIINKKVKDYSGNELFKLL